MEIGVISGIPGRNITVQLAFFDRSAVCKFMAIRTISMEDNFEMNYFMYVANFKHYGKS